MNDYIIKVYVKPLNKIQVFCISAGTLEKAFIKLYKKYDLEEKDLSYEKVTRL